MRYKRMPKLYESLGTKNRKQQEEIVQQLINATKADVLDVVIRYDLRQANPIVNVMVIGGQPPHMAVVKIMEMARDEVLKQAISSSGPPEKPPDEPPQHPYPQAEDTGEPSPELNAPEVAAE
jgi:hypothetical protein